MSEQTDAQLVQKLLNDIAPYLAIRGMAHMADAAVCAAQRLEARGESEAFSPELLEHLRAEAEKLKLRRIDLTNIKTKQDVLHVIKVLSEHIGEIMEGDVSWAGEVMTSLDRAADVIEGKV